MKIEFLPPAKQELDDAIEYYNLQVKDLGKHFKQEIKSALKRIQNFPYAWSEVESEMRKCVLHKFPYNIYYSIQKNKIIILAIAHHHQKPNYWIDRKIDE